MIKRFRIVVDGVAHEVEVEELGSVSTPSVTAAPAAAPAPRPVAAPTAPAAPTPKAAPAAAGAGTVTAPLQGTILDVAVSVGQAVQPGQLVAVIEAMKMENEIMAPIAGTVVSVSVHKGDSVALGDVLVTLQ